MELAQEQEQKSAQSADYVFLNLNERSCGDCGNQEAVHIWYYHPS